MRQPILKHSNQKIMTKQEYALLQQAAEVLDRLSEKDGNNEAMPVHYRNSLTEANDHYSQMMYSVEKDEATIVVPGFWNDELRRVVEDAAYNTQKETPYEVGWVQNLLKEYTLSIIWPGQYDTEEELDDLTGLYNNYLDETQVKEDLQLLVKAGYKLVNEDGTLLDLL
jgi:hypothetical protein